MGVMFSNEFWTGEMKTVGKIALLHGLGTRTRDRTGMDCSNGV